MRFFLLAFLSASLLAQTPRPAFETAAIRPCAPEMTMALFQAGQVSLKVDDSRFSAHNYSLLNLIQYAWRVPMDQLEKPGWLSVNAPLVNLEAKIPAVASKEQAQEMMQALLEERYRLKVHHEERNLPVYALMVAKDGPKFHESAAENTNPGGCNGGYRKVCTNATMDGLARQLSQGSRMHALGAPDRPVIDMTGPKGKYDFVLEAGREGLGRGRGEAGDPDAPITTICDGLKALGLRLEPMKHPFDYLVVDHIERTPTEN